MFGCWAICAVINVIIFPLVSTTLPVALSQSCLVFVDRFRPPSAKSNKFFLRFGSGNAIVNPTNELDSLQHDFNLPFICSSNARHVVETLKGNAGLDATSSARHHQQPWARAAHLYGSTL